MMLTFATLQPPESFPSDRIWQHHAGPSAPGAPGLFAELPRTLKPTPRERRALHPFQDLWARHYRLIYADPALAFELRSEKGEAKSPQARYRCETPEEVASLPVGDLAFDDSVLFMWTTWPMLAAGHAHRIVEAWGFQAKTGGSWCKLSKTGTRLAFGPGYIVRSADEPFLIATRGEPVFKDGEGTRSVRNLIVDLDDFPFRSDWAISAPVREHSRKPDQTIGLIETLFDGPYVELNARTRRAGWDSWGDQVGMFA